MAARGWGVSIVTAVGVAGGASAAQLGLGYGLDIISWMPTSAPDSEATWVASLAWATWIAATSVIIGAICADRLAGSPGPQSTVGSAEAWVGRQGTERYGSVGTALWRLVLALAAAVGAALTVALVAVPARSAVRADSFAPETIAGAYAAVGVIAGLLLAYSALSSAAVAANVVVTVSWLWLLAVIAMGHGALTGHGIESAQLGVWEFTTDGPWFRGLYLPGSLLSLVAALVIGALAAWPAVRRQENRVGVAVSGAVGPLLITLAYFLATPQLAGTRSVQFSAYLIAPYAVIAGLAGSVLVSALGPVKGQPADAPDSATEAPSAGKAGAPAAKSPSPTSKSQAPGGQSPSSTSKSQASGGKGAKRRASPAA